MRRRTKTIITLGAMVIVFAIIISLLIWTIESPAPLPVQSESSLTSGLFGSSSSTVGYNISDSSGTYFFKFGLDYSSPIPNGGSTRMVVYCGLVSGDITSGFTKGIALSLQSSTLLIDGQSYSDVKVSSQRISGLQAFYFEIQNLALTSGNHTIEIKTFLATADVNYIGNTLGAYLTVSLNGTLDVSPLS
jgi:hypothetical protein